MATEQLDLQKALKVPYPDDLINTTKGPIRAGDLNRKVIETENDEHLTYAIEYRDNTDEDPIHRSVHVQLKHSTAASSVAASF